MERDPPDAFCYLGSGPTNGRRHGSAPGFGFDFETTSDQIDSAKPRKRTLRAQGVLTLQQGSGGEGIAVISLWRTKTPAYQPVVRRDSR
jgi:hypothetical protein